MFLSLFVRKCKFKCEAVKQKEDVFLHYIYLGYFGRSKSKKNDTFSHNIYFLLFFQIKKISIFFYSLFHLFSVFYL